MAMVVVDVTPSLTKRPAALAVAATPAPKPSKLAVMSSAAFTTTEDPFRRPPLPTLALTVLLIVLLP